MHATGLIGMVAGAAVLFALVGKGKAAPRVVNVQAGRRYRFHFEVEPDLERTEGELLRAALGASGAETVGLERTGDVTTGRVVMRAAADRELSIGEPFLQVGKHVLTVQRVDAL